MRFADLPGYGYAKISKSISAEWPKFIEPYLADRESLQLCVCLVDSNAPPQPRDGQLIDWLRHVGRPFVIVATKVDRLSGNERTRNMAALKKGLELEDILPCVGEDRLRNKGTVGADGRGLPDSPDGCTGIHAIPRLIHSHASSR